MYLNFVYRGEYIWELLNALIVAKKFLIEQMCVYTAVHRLISV